MVARGGKLFYSRSDSFGEKPEESLAHKLDQSAKKRARDHDGCGHHETRLLLRDLCPDHVDVHQWILRKSNGERTVASVWYVPEWECYKVSIEFTNGSNTPQRTLDLRYFFDGALCGYLPGTSVVSDFEEFSELGAETVSHGTPEEQEIARIEALGILIELRKYADYSVEKIGPDLGDDVPDISR